MKKYIILQCVAVQNTFALKMEANSASESLLDKPVEQAKESREKITKADRARVEKKFAAIFEIFRKDVGIDESWGYDEFVHGMTLKSLEEYFSPENVPAELLASFNVVLNSMHQN